MLGRLQEAGGLLTALDEEARAGHRWATPAALRSRALILVARGDVEAADAAASERSPRFRDCRIPARPRTRTVGRGQALRRAGERRRAAREARGGESDFREPRRDDLGRPRREGAATSQIPPSSRWGAHECRASSCSSGGRGKNKPRGGCPTLHDRRDSGGASHPDLPQARRTVANRARSPGRGRDALARGRVASGAVSSTAVSSRSGPRGHLSAASERHGRGRRPLAD